MFILRAWYRIHSLWKCHGSHDFQKVRYFYMEKDGPELDPMFGKYPGRWATFGRCRRCRLREDGTGFDY